MGSRLSPGDQVICKIKDDKIVNIYESNDTQKKIFDIVSKYNEGYLIYIPLSLFLQNTIYIYKNNYIQYNIDKRFIDSSVCFITEHNVLAIYSRLDGLCCAHCGEFCQMAVSNQEDGTFVCWICVNYRIYK
jgi:hypothetical protein